MIDSIFSPQDLASTIRGKLTSKKGSTVLHGEGSCFTEDVQAGSTVLVKALSIAAKVEEVVSDTVLKLQVAFV